MQAAEPMTREAWAASMRRLHEEAAGVVGVTILQPRDMPELMAAALAGDPMAVGLLRTATDTINRIEAAPRRRPMLCGSCPRPLKVKKGLSIVVATPDKDAPEQCLALAICTRCGTTVEEVQEKAVVALRRIWPDTRQVTITHPEGGRA